VAMVSAQKIAGELEGLERLEREFSTCEVSEREAVKERDKAMTDIDVCPLTLRPISGECLKEEA